MIAVFAVVYLAMVLGHLPGLAIDRTGAALLGAIVLVAARRISPPDAVAAIDVPTMALLFGSIANLIVVEQAARLGIAIGWREHARVGVPVTAATLAIAAIWLALRA